MHERDRTETDQSLKLVFFAAFFNATYVVTRKV